MMQEQPILFSLILTALVYGHTEDILRKKINQKRSSLIYGELMDLASLPAETEA